MTQHGILDPSGKAGAMITLARFAFRKVDGVEISPPLVAVAKRNLAKLKITPSRVFLRDAAKFTDRAEYTYVLPYNPFPAVVLVLGNLAVASLKIQFRASNCQIYPSTLQLNRNWDSNVQRLLAGAQLPR